MKPTKLGHKLPGQRKVNSLVNTPYGRVLFVPTDLSPSLSLRTNSDSTECPRFPFEHGYILREGAHGSSAGLEASFDLTWSTDRRSNLQVDHAKPKIGIRAKDALANCLASLRHHSSSIRGVSWVMGKSPNSG